MRNLSELLEETGGIPDIVSHNRKPAEKADRPPPTIALEEDVHGVRPDGMASDRPIPSTAYNTINDRRPKPTLVGVFDIVTIDGFVEGWARNEGDCRPCMVEIRQNEKIIAKTVADNFRPDLLKAGIGHGHYAFSARVSNATPGECLLEMAETRLGVVIPVGGTAAQIIPVPKKSTPFTVEAMLRRRQWTVEEVTTRIDCLKLAENMHAMGPYRFVDVTFQFLLNRWMDDAGSIYVRQLETGAISPEGFFRELVSSEERSNKSGVIPGPYDARFPYILL